MFDMVFFHTNPSYKNFHEPSSPNIMPHSPTLVDLG